MAGTIRMNVRYKALIAVVSVIWPFLASAAPVGVGVGDPVAARSAEAQEKYEAGEYGEALTLYRDAQLEDPNSGLLKFNVGDALFKTGDFEGALKEFLQSAAGDDPEVQGPAWYNAGNAHFELQQFKEAVEAYKEALERLPADVDAKANLEFALQQMQEQSQPQEDGEGEDGEEEGEEGEQGETPESTGDEEKADAGDEGDDSSQQSENSAAEGEDEEEDEEATETSAGDESDERDGTDSEAEREAEGSMEPEEAERLLDALSSDELDAQRRRIRLKPGRQAKDW